MGVRPADASRADAPLMAHGARAVTEAGAGLVVLADTAGCRLPRACRAMSSRVGAAWGPGVVLASHLPTDLGLGLANTLAALAAGVRTVSCSCTGTVHRTDRTAGPTTVCAACALSTATRTDPLRPALRTRRRDHVRIFVGSASTGVRPAP